MFEIKRYTHEMADEWNSFVANSLNGTFLLDRRYMDYHADRFDDHSIVFYLNEHLYALLPANEKEHVLYSHQGLTYGGLIVGQLVHAAEMLSLFSELNAYLRQVGIQRVVYKAIPWIYRQIPSEEDLYALTQVCHAQLTVRELSTSIVLPKNIRWSRIRRRGIKRAKEAGVTIQKSDDYASFWPVLEDNLLTNHHVRPVHELSEIELLHNRFPQNIVLYLAKIGDEVLGGVVLYLTSQVVHAQYSSATPLGKRLGVLDAVYDRIMHDDWKDFPYFDFGKSTENDGQLLNETLIAQKEGFGGRGLCYDTYEWTL